MFMSKQQIIDEVKHIIADDTDNDVIFVVAQKGIGKTKLLNEIYGTIEHETDLIVADGKEISSSMSVIKRCFIEGILTYFSKNNSGQLRSTLRKYFRSKRLLEQISLFTKGKNRLQRLSSELSSFTYYELKSIYYDLAGSTPLVIVSSAMDLIEEEVSFLSQLSNDPLSSKGARITFVIGIRGTPDNLQKMDIIIKKKIQGIKIIPLLPRIQEVSTEDDPRSIATICLEEAGIIEDIEQLLNESDVYIDTFNVIRYLCEKGWETHYLLMFAHQEISLKSYYYIRKITNKIYKRFSSRYDNRIVLPNNGKLLWLDVVSYYLAFQNSVEEAIIGSQRFFLALINEILSSNNRLVYKKRDRNAFTDFIKEASSYNGNILAKGFAKYYSEFALLVQVMFSTNVYGNRTFQDFVDAAEVLDHIMIEYSDENIDAINNIYGNTQICYVLDIGLKMINNLFQNNNPDRLSNISKKTQTNIASYLRTCMLAAYKWQDQTLVEGIVKVSKEMSKSSYPILFSFDELTAAEETKPIYISFLQELKKYGLRIGDVIMPKKTIFLSYAHKNKDIANRIDNNLQNLGYDVKRDIRDVEEWGSLQEFMKTIRKEDYVVLLVSDHYLRQDNCMYEVMQLLKDELYENRTFPIVIGFSEKEKQERLNQSREESMFKPEYRLEIVLFWQERARSLREQIENLEPENRAEFDAKYREIKNMAQTASAFLDRFFENDLLMVIEKEKPKYKSVSLKIDKMIQKRQTK